MLLSPILSKLIKKEYERWNPTYFICWRLLHQITKVVIYLLCSFLNINRASAQNDLRSYVHRSTYLTSVLCSTQTFHSQSHQRVDHIHRQKFQSQKKESREHIQSVFYHFTDEGSTRRFCKVTQVAGGTSEIINQVPQMPTTSLGYLPTFSQYWPCYNILQNHLRYFLRTIFLIIAFKICCNLGIWSHLIPLDYINSNQWNMLN